MNRREKFEKKYPEHFRDAVRTVLAEARGHGNLTDKNGQEAVRLLGWDLIEEIKQAVAHKEAMGRRMPGCARN